jgi:hypothetical protein
MTVACLASIAVLAGSMAALYGLDWYKNRRKQNRKLTEKLVERWYYKRRTTTNS